ncbi:GNAT family N-acetyltransferase [soil metagenome]
MHPLDNLVWNALDGYQREHAIGSDLARRFDPAISVFAGVPDAAGPEHWSALADVLAGTAAIVTRVGLELPPDWTVDVDMPGIQMVAAAESGAAYVDAVELSASDGPEALDLATRTEPGPFSLRTPELGTYVGVRRQGKLVAMAGERMRAEGFTEISAVCTDPAYRGHGLAGALVRHMVDQIQARGDVALLHVVASNAPAIRVYERLGFTVRARPDFKLIRATPSTKE